MKQTPSRRYRRHVASTETKIAKKDNQQEQAFFSTPSKASFFKPNVAIQRKCAGCEAEEKLVRRLAGPVEEEKKVQKMDDKKEEKQVHRQAGPAEEEKKVQKMDDKKEEKEVHRQAGPGEEEKKVQKMDDKKEKEVHRQSDNKEEEKTVAKKDDGAGGNGAQVTGAYIQSLGAKGHALPDNAQQFFGERIGYNFSQVKIHTGTEAEQSAKEINAKAYTIDNNIVFNKGQYNPASAEGKSLLAHELTHVVQQQGNEKNVLNRVADNTAHANSNAILLNNYGKTGTQNKRAYGCEGVNVQGHTDANYSNSFDPTATAKPSTTCKDCDPPDCITVTGTLVSTFTASPVITLPTVPDGLSDCETRAITKFINTTLKRHEQQHVAAFNTYNGVKRTPYKFTGCKADFDIYMQQQQVLHDELNDKKTADANAKSDALDPFSPTIPCDCD